MKLFCNREAVSLVIEMRFNPQSTELNQGTASLYQSPDALDRVGATASLVCAIHCAIMPLAFTLLPLIGLQFLARSWVEWTLVGFSAVIGVTSLCFGYREHRSRRALALLGIGLALLVLGRVGEDNRLGLWSIPTVVLGGLTIAGSHIFNRWLCRQCRVCHHDH